MFYPTGEGARNPYRIAEFEGVRHMNLRVYEPANLLNQLHHEMNRLFETGRLVSPL